MNNYPSSRQALPSYLNSATLSHSTIPIPHVKSPRTASVGKVVITYHKKPTPQKAEAIRKAFSELLGAGPPTVTHDKTYRPWVDEMIKPDQGISRA